MGLFSWLFSSKPISFEGGAGETLENAVIVRGARNAMRGVSAEYGYLNERFGQQGVAWNLIEQRLQHGEDGKHYDVFRLALQDNREVEVYMDISEFYGRIF